MDGKFLGNVCVFNGSEPMDLFGSLVEISVIDCR